MKRRIAHSYIIAFTSLFITSAFSSKAVAQNCAAPNPPSYGSWLRASHEYAVMRGFPTGFWNFHYADYGSGLVFGFIFIHADAVSETRLVPVQELSYGGDPHSSVQIAFAAVDAYLSRKKLPPGGAFPRFEPTAQANWTLILLKQEAYEVRAVDAVDLTGQPDFNDVEHMFISTSDYATANGFAAGFPMFRTDNQGRFYTVLLKEGMAHLEDVSPAILVSYVPCTMKTVTLAREICSGIELGPVCFGNRKCIPQISDFCVEHGFTLEDNCLYTCQTLP
jgi:hypothetical protein